MTPTPKSEPVLTATLLAPVLAWLIAFFWPGTDVSTEQATQLAGVVLLVGSVVARSRVRPTWKPSPSAEKLLAGRRRPVRDRKPPPFDAP